MNYYNEFDPHAAQWLRNLIATGAIPAGFVDTRSIVDVRPEDLAGYNQCHFFAGIGGWALALNLAGVSPSTRLWTGSCPCQPFSAAGKRKGTDDERHLWPVFRDLIAECQPPVVLGEQVASADGRDWLSTVRADLEALGYAVGGADLCAAGIGAPHIRQRLYFVGLADANRERHDRLDPLLRTDVTRRHEGKISEAARGGADGRLADADDTGPQGRDGTDTDKSQREEAARHSGSLRAADELDNSGRTGAPDNPWAAADWLSCRDGRWRPVEPGTFPLAHGVPGRVGLLRGYGNAIVPQVAATFIRAALETKNNLPNSNPAA